jgi:dienelactone hydrolase
MAIGRGLMFLVALLTALGTSPALGDEPQRQRDLGLNDLNQRLERLRSGAGAASAVTADHVADAAVFAKAVAWALRYDGTQLKPADETLVQKALEAGRRRVAALEAGNHPWTRSKGRVVRGFVSAVDGSIQPYGLIVPANYDRNRPMRLDVVLHGSSRPEGMSELRFMSRFDAAESQVAPTAEYVELHPLGRVENAYRWAGETDVFEAIEVTCRNYAIDRDRIVLRGMSMGASGTWHLGLKHPDRFVALGPYCGYVDTHEFSRTPLPNFVEVGPLPPHQEQALHLLDSIDYAANAGMVPAIACMGDKDIFFQAHVLMKQAMEKEGLRMVNLISAGTGHVLDPATHQEQLRRIKEYADRGRNNDPRHIRFVTWSLKYSRCAWLEILGLQTHYARAELEARIADDGAIEIAEPKNVTRFAILRPRAEGEPLRVGGQAVAAPGRATRPASKRTVIGKQDGRWVYLGEDLAMDGKRPGLQGPIDDAFTSPFLCVRGTGRAWNARVGAWSEATLRRFASEWHHYFRGELPVKDDTAVTADDIQRCHLILFGDPGSNRWIERVLPQLPLRWTSNQLEIGKSQYSAADFAPVLISPNPLSHGRYVVINSGHTFHESELASLNYLLFPRLGDWAVVHIKGSVSPNAADLRAEFVVKAGYCDENWKISESVQAMPPLLLAPAFHPPRELAQDLGSYSSPLRMSDGTRVSNATDWARRRREIRKTWHDFMGPWPALIENPRIEYLKKERRDPFTQHLLRLEIAPGMTTEDAYLLVPDGKGPFPAVLVVYYEARTAIGQGQNGLLDFAAQLAKRGFVALSLGSAPASYYPNKDKAQLQPLSFHAYVAANCYNALAGLEQVDSHRIGILGHSYGGKWAMFAAGLHDKFACGVWSDPGIVFDETRANVNYWEPWYLGYEPGHERRPGIPDAKNPRTGAYARLVAAGHDLHELLTLMAPRPFLVSGGSEDPPERWRALNHAVAVNRLLGVDNRVAMTNRPGHAPTAQSNEQIYLFFEYVLRSRPAATPR